MTTVTDPWAVLGLARGEVGRDAIEAAYAAALRAVPSGADAAGSQAIRQAYELLTGTSKMHLRWMAEDLDRNERYASWDRQREARSGLEVTDRGDDAEARAAPMTADEPPVDPPVEPVVEPAPPEPAPVDEPAAPEGTVDATGVVESPEPPSDAVPEEAAPALDAGQTEAPERAAPRPPTPSAEAWAAEVRADLVECLASDAQNRRPQLRGLLAAAWTDSAGSRPRRQALLQMLDGSLPLVAQGAIAASAPRAMLIDGLVEGDYEVAHWLARTLVRSGHPRQLRGIALLVAQHAADLHPAGAHIHVARLAEAIAVVDPSEAERLVGVAKDLATLSDGDELDTAAVETRLRVAREVAHWPSVARGQLTWILDHHGVPAGEALDTFDEVVEGLDQTETDTVTHMLLEKCAPELIGRTRRVIRPRRRPRLLRSRQEGGLKRFILVMAGMLFALWLLRTCIEHIQGETADERRFRKMMEENKRFMRERELQRKVHRVLEGD